MKSKPKGQGSAEQKILYYRGIFKSAIFRKYRFSLDRLAKTNPVALAIQLAIKIDFKDMESMAAKSKLASLSAYKKKHEMIYEMVDLFRVNWPESFGMSYHLTNTTSHVVYFDIPGCGRVVWRINPWPNYQLPETKNTVSSNSRGNMAKCVKWMGKITGYQEEVAQIKLNGIYC